MYLRRETHLSADTVSADKKSVQTIPGCVSPLRNKTITVTLAHCLGTRRTGHFLPHGHKVRRTLSMRWDTYEKVCRHWLDTRTFCDRTQCPYVCFRQSNVLGQVYMLLKLNRWCVKMFHIIHCEYIVYSLSSFWKTTLLKSQIDYFKPEATPVCCAQRPQNTWSHRKVICGQRPPQKLLWPYPRVFENLKKLGETGQHY